MTLDWTQRDPNVRAAQVDPEKVSTEQAGLHAQIKSSKARTESMLKRAIGLETNFIPGLEQELEELQAKMPKPPATVRGVEGASILVHSIMLPIGLQSVHAIAGSILCTDESLVPPAKAQNPTRAVYVVTPETLATIKGNGHAS